MRQSCPTRVPPAIPMPFQNIDRTDCFIVQEERHTEQEIMQAAALWNAHGPDLFLRRGSIEILETQLGALLPAGTKALAEDALNLVRRYQRLSGTAEIRFRLEKVRHDSCRRFHVDHVPLRLLCTYTGPGVQWKYADSETIYETPAGWITLLKGQLYPGWSTKGAVLHRSPPISDRPVPVTRLLLTLDHPDACGMGRQ
ncbi:DUF1826 domain-containing protein [Komagataeibacter oboediens]|uniref:DUF1826 domain-containing protein n=2 Tax=Komagataeibacter oboediens TaxID=65958 RepID=A0ABS5SLR5_9PROT|nr:DUF1826 domain-containing protein [Komagataeibacter oboediens]MBL7234394.1 DUF1826 domain-containing protein [Komagataeibacter oboediens]MBT0675153.1 DUF1826 domain-containing protein [Komagataeibacter oboediens]MBT0678764.1 DUF1826 domain-containing protein [Komagataeibacter oboediens]